MDYDDEDIFKHAKTYGYSPDFTTEKFIITRIRKLHNKLENSPIKKQLLEDIAICRKELQQKIKERIVLKCMKKEANISPMK